MNKTSGIYSITNTINGKTYYGSSNWCEHRWSQHKSQLNKNKHGSPHLQNAWSKYGEHVFKFEILKQVPVGQLLDIEQTYLDKVKEQPELYYNTNFIAEKPPSSIGRKDSLETRKKKSIALKGRFVGNKSWCFGKSPNNKGVPWTDEQRNKMRGDKNPMFGKFGKLHHRYGKVHSKELIDQISKSSKITRQTPEYLKKVCNQTRYTFKNRITNEEFTGIQRDFYKKYNLSPCKTHALIKNIRKSHKGWILCK